MHDHMMSQIGGIDQEQHHHHGQEGAYGNNDGWVDLSSSYGSSQHQSPVFEHNGFAFIQPVPHSLPTESSFQRMPPPQSSHPHHQQLLPLIMPSHPTWPSMYTHPPSHSAPPVAIPPASSMIKGHMQKLPAIHPTPTPRKTLTDSDRRRMCQYHEDNPTTKQTEIGGEKDAQLLSESVDS